MRFVHSAPSAARARRFDRRSRPLRATTRASTPTMEFVKMAARRRRKSTPPLSSSETGFGRTSARTSRTSTLPRTHTYASILSTHFPIRFVEFLPSSQDRLRRSRNYFDSRSCLVFSGTTPSATPSTATESISATKSTTTDGAVHVRLRDRFRLLLRWRFWVDGRGA